MYEDQAREIITKINRETAIKGITKMVVKYSAAGVTTLIITAYCPVTKKKHKLQLAIGAWAIGGVVGEKAGDWASETIWKWYQEVVDLIEQVKSSWSKSKSYSPAE